MTKGEKIGIECDWWETILMWLESDKVLMKEFLSTSPKKIYFNKKSDVYQNIDNWCMALLELNY